MQGYWLQQAGRHIAGVDAQHRCLSFTSEPYVKCAVVRRVVMSVYLHLAKSSPACTRLLSADQP
eukprot:scaffold114018_cov18-Tisochrysis_lutea.AAC.1